MIKPGEFAIAYEKKGMFLNAYLIASFTDNQPALIASLLCGIAEEPGVEEDYKVKLAEWVNVMIKTTILEATEAGEAQ